MLIHDIDRLTCAAVALAVLVCWKPAGILVSSVFKGIPATIEQASQTSEESDKIEIEGAKIGYWIGVLEREIILMLGLMGQFGAIVCIVIFKVSGIFLAF